MADSWCLVVCTFFFLRGFHLVTCDICNAPIDAALKIMERPDSVLLFVGAYFWEFNRRTGQFVGVPVLIRDMFKELPGKVDSAMYLLRNDMTYKLEFVRGRTYYTYSCRGKLERCEIFLTTPIPLENILNEGIHFGAMFGYQPGMPQPENRTQYEIHVHLTNKQEMDCAGISSHGANCVLRPVPKGLYPNLDKLRPYEEPILAIEAFYDNATRRTDFFVAGGSTIRYTIDGEEKIGSQESIFHCPPVARVMSSFIVLLSIIHALILVGFSYFTFKHKKSISETEIEVPRGNLK